MTPSNHRWPLIRLATVVEFRNGINFSKENFGTGIKVIGVGDFQDNVRASFDDLEQINPEGIVRKEHLLKNGDILFVRSNGNRKLIGRSMFVKGLREDVTHSAFSIRLRFACDKCHPQFYSYFFRSVVIRQALSLHGGGTNISNLNQDILGRLEVPLPPKPVQCKIASILSAYDDLIENNARRIRILEEMTQMLYREWFLNFRFPGCKKAKMAESEWGPIPDAWKTARLGDLVEEIIDYRGKTPKKLGGEWAEYGVLALSALNVKQGRLENLDKARFVSEELYGKWMKSELRAGDILMTSEAPLGEVYFLPETRKYCLSQRVFSLRANPTQIKPAVLYLFLSSPNGQNQVRARASGTTVVGIRQADLRQILVVQPDLATQGRAEAILLPFLMEIDVLHQQAANIRQTRDLLLPRLISGEIDVEHLETEAAAQGV